MQPASSVSPYSDTDPGATPPVVDEGLYLCTAEFFTEHTTIHAEIKSPEMRLSDHLNSSARSVDVRPFSLTERASGGQVELGGSYARVIKDRVLFAVLCTEPARPPRDSNPAWKSTVQRRCWASAGGYRIAGTIHLEPGKDVHTALRTLTRQFVPITNATVTTHGRQIGSYQTLLINQDRVDMIAVKPEA